MGGLACMCLNQNDCNHNFPKQVDIYCRQQELWAKGLNINILGSKTEPGEFIPEFGVKICRVQFEQLIEEQVTQLENIIVRYSAPA